jgi:hypothetical protein
MDVQVSCNRFSLQRTNALKWCIYALESRRQVHPDLSLLTSLLTIHLRWLANSATSLRDDVIEYAKTHEDAKGALLTFQKEADQIYFGWKDQFV